MLLDVKDPDGEEKEDEDEKKTILRTKNRLKTVNFGRTPLKFNNIIYSPSV